MKQITFLLFMLLLSFNTLSASKKAAELNGVRYKFQNTTKEVQLVPIPLIKNWYLILTSKYQLKSDSLSNNIDNRIIDPLATAGFVIGLFGWVVLPLVGPIFAIICSLMALSRIKKYPEKYTGKGTAVAGLVLGIIGFLLPVTIAIFLLTGVIPFF